MIHASDMAEKSSKQHKKKEPTDTNELAFDIVQDLTSEEPREAPEEKSLSAIERGRLGGLKGGQVRAKKLSGKKRAEIAAHAANVRWKKGLGK